MVMKIKNKFTWLCLRVKKILKLDVLSGKYVYASPEARLKLVWTNFHLRFFH